MLLMILNSLYRVMFTISLYITLDLMCNQMLTMISSYQEKGKVIKLTQVEKVKVSFLSCILRVSNLAEDFCTNSWFYSVKSDVNLDL